MRKFDATPVLGGTPLILGDDSVGDHISGGVPEAHDEVQTFKPFRGPNTIRFDRGNATHVMRWTVARDHGTESAALAFLRDHPQAVAQLGICILEDFGSNIDSRWWLNAKVRARALRNDGQSTEFEYTMEAGAISTTSP